VLLWRSAGVQRELDAKQRELEDVAQQELTTSKSANGGDADGRLQRQAARHRTHQDKLKREVAALAAKMDALEVTNQHSFLFLIRFSL
jgi:hypothetical protein